MILKLHIKSTTPVPSIVGVERGCWRVLQSRVFAVETRILDDGVVTTCKIEGAAEFVRVEYFDGKPISMRLHFQHGYDEVLAVEYLQDFDPLLSNLSSNV